MPNGQSRRRVAHARHSGIAMGLGWCAVGRQNLSSKGMFLATRSVDGGRSPREKSERDLPFLASHFGTLRLLRFGKIHCCHAEIRNTARCSLDERSAAISGLEWDCRLIEIPT
jgi:hypothetical protein